MVIRHYVRHKDAVLVLEVTIIARKNAYSTQLLAIKATRLHNCLMPTSSLSTVTMRCTD